MGNYYLYRIAQFFTTLLPRKMAYGLAVFVADCHCLFSKNDRLAVRENLKVILKVDDVSPVMVRQVFRNFGKYLVDFFTMTRHVNTQFIKEHVHINHVDHVNDVLKHGKGAIVMSGHLGNWEMAGAVLSLLAYPLSVVALPHKDSRVNKFFNDQREFFGTRVIPTTTAVRRVMEHLQDNRLVAIIAERDFSQRGLRMDFLGKPTMIPKGVAMFALKTGAPIVPCFFMRKDNDDFEVNFGAPIYPPTIINGKISDEDLNALIPQYISLIEQEIRRNPTQWLMFREFWIS